MKDVEPNPVKTDGMSPWDMLTPRQREVFSLKAVGYENGDIGMELAISEKTAEAHVKNILNIGLASSAKRPDEKNNIELFALINDAIVFDYLGYCPDPDQVSALRKLTPSELDVANEVKYGLSNSEIAEKRGSAKKTVETQLRNIFIKTDVRNRIHLSTLLMYSQEQERREKFLIEGEPSDL